MGNLRVTEADQREKDINGDLARKVLYRNVFVAFLFLIFSVAVAVEGGSQKITVRFSYEFFFFFSGFIWEVV